MSEWYGKLPPFYLELAEKNYKIAPYDGTFVWSKTEEGFDFWLNVLLMAFEIKPWPQN